MRASASKRCTAFSASASGRRDWSSPARASAWAASASIGGSLGGLQPILGDLGRLAAARQLGGVAAGLQHALLLGDRGQLALEAGDAPGLLAQRPLQRAAPGDALGAGGGGFS